MAFLDNSGNIILDTVLTEIGRKRMATGNFKISKFALGDDEIDYNLYDKNNASGSAYYDLQIMQTPIFEAFTNNASSMKSKLISIANNNLLYLPIIELNEVFSTDVDRHGDGVFYVAVNDTTEDLHTAAHNVLYGENLYDVPLYIRLDAGLDTNAISPKVTIPADLNENQYMVQMDNRFGELWSGLAPVRAPLSFIDDDQIATYYLSLASHPDFVIENSVTSTGGGQCILGPRSTIVNLKVKASLALADSNQLFDELGGGTVSVTGTGGATSLNYL